MVLRPESCGCDWSGNALFGELLTGLTLQSDESDNLVSVQVPGLDAAEMSGVFGVAAQKYDISRPSDTESEMRIWYF